MDIENTNVLSHVLKDNIKKFKDIFSHDDVVRYRELTIKTANIDCLLIFIDGMVNSQILNDSVVRPILTNQKDITTDVGDLIIKNIMFAGEISQTSSIDQLIGSLLYGDTVLIADGYNEGFIINTKGWKTRGISEPENERVLEGPREGFEESVMLNMAMIRRKLPTSDLRVQYMQIGKRTETKIFICYLNSVVNRHALRTLKDKLKNINIDSVLDSNYLKELLLDGKPNLFKTIGSTERPDIIAAKLLEGRVAILVDGTPMALTLPYLFSENFQADDDYYLNYLFASVGRILRCICFFLAISVPAIYLALITHHRELIPSSYFTTVTQSRNGVPFPSVIEALLLILIFEILRETGIRMPQSVGHALSIVGGLVVGQAAVEADIVSAPMLIIVALSGIAGLMIPKLKNAVFYGRIALVPLAAITGLYGYFFGIVFIVTSILSNESFGINYTIAFENISFQNLKDTVIRSPWNLMIKRPYKLSKNKIRQGKK